MSRPHEVGRQVALPPIEQARAWNWPGRGLESDEKAVRRIANELGAADAGHPHP